MVRQQSDFLSVRGLGPARRLAQLHGGLCPAARRTVGVDFWKFWVNAFEEDPMTFNGCRLALHHISEACL